MEANIDLFRTLKPDNKSGILMRSDIYEGIKREIIHVLSDEEGVPLQSFFEILHTRFVELFGEKTGWYLYHVKLDLETRAVLKVERSKGKRNIRTVVSMTAAYRKHQTRLTIL